MKKGTSKLKLILFFFLVSACVDKEEVYLPYKKYYSIINQTGEGDPIETILLNELDLSIQWTRESRGTFKGSLSKPIDLDKAIISIQLTERDRIAAGGFENSETIIFHSLDRFNPYDEFDGITRGAIEIKVFPDR